MKPVTVFWLGILLLAGLPSVFSFDCSVFTNATYDSCVALNSTHEELIASLLYRNTSFPNHDFITNYNNGIPAISTPNNATLHNGSYIKNAWVKILTVQPSIKYGIVTLVPESIIARAAMNYTIVLPANYYNSHEQDEQTCSITYSIVSESSSLAYFRNGLLVSANMSIVSDSNITAQATITTAIQGTVSQWHFVCDWWHHGYCTDYHYDCNYHNTNYYQETLTAEDSWNVTRYASSPNAEVEILRRYRNTSQFRLNQSNVASLLVSIGNSTYKESHFTFDAEFIDAPNYFLQLTAHELHSTQLRNLIASDGYFYAASDENCSVFYQDFFTAHTEACMYNYSAQDVQPIAITPASSSWNLLFLLAAFIFVMYIIYVGIKHYWGRYLIGGIVLILAIPAVHAEDCGLTNLATCIPEAIFNFVTSLLNAPLQPLLTLMCSLLESAPSIELFGSVWAIMVYCISIFYTFLFIFAGVQFLISGYNVVRREMAKEWLRNTIIMIVLIQASFYLYGLVLEVAARLTTGVLSLVDPTFFLLTADNLANLGLEFILTFAYLIIILLTVIMLTIRYLVVAFGVIFMPIAIFCYFIPPLKSFGKLMLNIVGMFIFIVFLDSLIILACSLLAQIPLFENIKILVMISCLAIVNLLFVIMAKHVITKSGLADSGDKIAAAVKYIGLMA